MLTNQFRTFHAGVTIPFASFVFIFPARITAYINDYSNKPEGMRTDILLITTRG